MMGNAVIRVHQHEVEIHRRARQRHMNLSVKPDGRLRVSCNRTRSVREISAFVMASETFISRRLSELAEAAERFPPRTFVSGESILYLGRRLELQLVWSWQRRPRVTISAENLEILTPLGSSPADRLKAIQDVYRREARRLFAARLDFWGGLMGLRANSLSVRGQRTLWGSCSGPGDISLNYKLLCAPLEVIDYVVIHELAHIPHRNHSPRFWSLVERFMPSWREHRDWLKAREDEIGRMFNVPG